MGDLLKIHQLSLAIESTNTKMKWNSKYNDKNDLFKKN